MQWITTQPDYSSTASRGVVLCRPACWY